MGFKVKVTNNGKVNLGRDNKLFTAGETREINCSGSAGLLEIVSHPDLSAEVLENTNNEYVPSSVHVVDGAEQQVDVNATPSAFQMASEEKIDLSQIAGSGDGGRIHKSDVDLFIEERRESAGLDRVTTEDPIEEQEAVMIAPHGVQKEDLEVAELSEAGVVDPDTVEKE